MGNQAEICAGNGEPSSVFSPSLALKRARMQRFLAWLAEQGAVFPFVKMDVRENSRSMHAACRIAKDAPVLHVPRPLMITEEAVKAAPIGKLIAARVERMSVSGYFSVFLLDGKREESFWKPYTDVLPQDFSNHPLFFSDAELTEMEGTDALRQIRDELRWSRNEYKLLKSVLPLDKLFSYADYLWAKCAVMSRVHHLVIDQKKVRALTPLADMPDHHDNANLRWDRNASQGFLYTASRPIDAGEELTIDYQLSNHSAAFRIYGFCPASEGNHKTEIQLPSMRPEHPSYGIATSLGVTRGEKRAFLVSANHDNTEARSMLSYLRHVVSDNPSAPDGSVARDSAENAMPLSDRANEFKVLSMLETACAAQLTAFPTSLEEDDALLRSDDLPMNVGNAVRVRLGEKKVLRYFQAYARTASLAAQTSQG